MHKDAIARVAAEHGLDVALVVAVVMQESAGDTYAWNPEPHYRYLWDVRRQKPFRSMTAAEVLAKTPPADFRSMAGDRDQEWWAQQASWGLMQVMGAVARELGFLGPYLCELVEPEIGLHYGCKKLAADLKWAKGDVKLALAAYNGGRGNPQFGYADKVLARMK